VQRLVALSSLARAADRLTDGRPCTAATPNAGRQPAWTATVGTAMPADDP